MKRLWASLILLVVLVVVCTLGLNTTRNASETMIKTVTAARDAEIAGNTARSVSLCEKAVKDWRAGHSVLCLYMPHARLEAIDQTLSGLPNLCKFGAKEQYLADCDRSITQLTYLTESEVPSIAKIF